MQDFLHKGDAEQRALRCIRRGPARRRCQYHGTRRVLQGPEGKFNKNYRAGVGLDGDLTELLKDLDDPSNLRPDLAIVRGFGAYSDLEVAFLICAKFVCCSITAASSLDEMVLSRKMAKIAQRVRQIKF